MANDGEGHQLGRRGGDKVVAAKVPPAKILPGNRAQRDAGAGRKLCGVPLKWLSLAALTGQTTLQVFVIKSARSGGTAYLASSCVFFAEILKTVLSLVLLSLETGGARHAASALREGWIDDPVESMKVAVPALAYIVQNSLILYSLETLSMPVQQVTYQFKTLAAALVGAALLGKRLSAGKWGALALLVLGVSLVQLPAAGRQLPEAAAAAATVGGAAMAAGQGRVLGLAAVLAACFISGFAGAYMEMVLKQSKASLWLRNVQLGFFGSIIGLGSAVMQDGGRIASDGLTQGYTWRVLLAIGTLGCGGLLVAVVLKYADNILRQFSTALSIILTSILSWAVVKDYQPDGMFVVGAILAITATFAYNFGWPAFVVAAWGTGEQQ